MSMLSQFISIRLLVLVLLLLHLAIAQRRGGSHSGGSDSDDGDDDGDNGGSGDDDGSGGGSSGGGDSALPSSPCDWGARHKAFGLPGIYYNGTLTIRHHITANTAWDKEVRDSPAPPDEFTNCQNDDRSAKTYDYPAILLVAPTGNDSDTNPFHWQLRAFQPANQVRGDNGVDFLDFEQRWVYIRSSDFVATNGTVSDYSERWPVRNKWRDADATQLNQVTRVYWPTKITSEDGGVYSSSAEYSHEPPSVNKADYNLPVRSYGKHTSQYVTLSDVCSFHQETEGIFGDAAALPRSEITTGDTNIATTTPTLWLATGATAEMAGIGGNSVQMTLNNSLERAAPLSGDRKAGCREPHQFEFSHFGSIHSSDDESSTPVPWSLTLELVLSFQGSLVEENSTTIGGMEGGKLLFGASYELPGGGADDESGSGELNVAWASVVLGLLLRLLLI